MATKPRASAPNSNPGDETEFDTSKMDLPEPVAAAPEGGQKLALNIAYYKPKSCGRWPIHGRLIGKTEYKAPKAKPNERQTFDALVFRLLSPCVGVNKGDNGEELVALKVGDDIALPVNYQTEPLLAVCERDACVPYFIKALREKDIGGEQTMWEFEVTAYPELAVSRDLIGGKLEAMYDKAIKALPATVHTGTVETSAPAAKA